MFDAEIKRDNLIEAKYWENNKEYRKNLDSGTKRFRQENKSVGTKVGRPIKPSQNRVSK